MPSLNTKLASAPNTQTNYVLKATSSTTIGNSLMYDDGTTLGIGLTSFGAWDSTIRAMEIGTKGNFYGGFNGGASVVYIGTNAYYNGGWKYANTSAYKPQLLDAGGGNWHFQNAATGTAGNAITWTTLMKISDNGNVGIGTPSVTNKLTIVGSETGTQITTVPIGKFVNTGNSFSKLIVGSDNANYDAVISMDNNATLANTKLRFYIGNGTNSTAGHSNDQIVLQGNGNVGIGTSSPGFPLEVYKDTTGYATINVRNPNTTVNSGASIRLYSSGYDNMPAEIINKPDATGGTLVFNIRKADGSYNDFVTFRGDGNIRMNSAVFGNTTSGTTRTVYIGNGDYFLGGISSVRASKKNINDISNIDWVYQLNPVTFNYRKKDEEGSYTEEIYDDLNYGLIAEDTAPIADFLINYNDKEDGTKEMVGIEYMRLITPMLKALQEQKKEIEELKALINK